MKKPFLESLLFVSYINLLALLPLFAAYRLAEHMTENNPGGLWNKIISSPVLLCSGVILIIIGISLKLVNAINPDVKTYAAIGINTIIMISAWIIPAAASAPDWLVYSAIETWTVTVASLLLISSLQVPITTIYRIFGSKK